MIRGSLSADDGMPTVCFVARGDFESRPGGDTTQWRMYERVVREAGLRPITWFDESSIPPADVYHAFNVDRPLDLYPKLAEVKCRGRPFILSTIHQPKRVADEILRLSAAAGRSRKLAVPPLEGAALGDDQGNRHGRTGSAHFSPPHAVPKLAATRAVASQERGPDHVLDWFRGNLRPGGLRLRDSAPSTGDCTQLVGGAGGCIGWEAGRICRPSGAARACRWSDRASEGKLTHSSAGGAVRVVTWSLSVCRSIATARSPAPFSRRCSGASTPSGSPASLDRRWLHSIATAVFCLNVSFVEVSPLVDVEALALGCPVSTTMYAMHHQLLPPDTPLCDPYDERSILDRLQWRPSRLPPRQLVDREMCARRLVDTYLALAHA